MLRRSVTACVLAAALVVAFAPTAHADTLVTIHVVDVSGNPYPAGGYVDFGDEITFHRSSAVVGGVATVTMPLDTYPVRYRTYTTTDGFVHNGAVQFDAIGSIDVNGPDVTLTLPRLQPLDMRVVTTDGSPVEQTSVELQCGPVQLSGAQSTLRVSSYSGSPVVNPDGSVSLGGLLTPGQPSPCTVSVIGWRQQVVQSIDLNNPGSVVVTVAPPPPYVDQVLRLQDPGGHPYPAGTIVRADFGFSGVLDVNGELAVRVRADDYALEIINQNLGGSLYIYSSLHAEGGVAVFTLPPLGIRRVNVATTEGLPAGGGMGSGFTCDYTGSFDGGATTVSVSSFYLASSRGLSEVPTFLGVPCVWDLGGGSRYRHQVPADVNEVTALYAPWGGFIDFFDGPLDRTVDGDSVPDVIEGLAPNNGDGNLDGVKDAEQANVASLPAFGGAALVQPFVTLAADSGTALVGASTLDPAGLPPAPGGASLPAGLVSYSLTGVSVGGDATVSLFVPDTTGVTGYAKLENGSWSLLPADRVQILSDRVVLRLTDGGVGDADGLANGVIVDPGGPATADQAGPSLTIDGVADGATYTLGAVPTTTCDASDSGSGLAGQCTLSLSGGRSNGVGTFTATARAADKAGNVSTSTATYRVVYRFDDFEQPINDPTAGAVSLSVFKKGSTVPVKFRLLNAAGQVVAPTVTPVWVTPQQGASLSSPVNESVYTDPPSTTDAFSQTGGKWQYLWSTKSVVAGSQFRIGVRLDDGTTRYVVVGVK